MQTAYCGPESPEHRPLVHLATFISSHFSSHLVHLVQVIWLLLGSLEHIKLFSAESGSSILPRTSFPLPLEERLLSVFPGRARDHFQRNHPQLPHLGCLPPMRYSVIGYHLNCLYRILTKSPNCIDMHV